MKDLIESTMACPNCSARVKFKARCKCMRNHKIWGCRFCGYKWETLGGENCIIEGKEAHDE